MHRAKRDSARLARRAHAVELRRHLHYTSTLEAELDLHLAVRRLHAATALYTEFDPVVSTPVLTALLSDEDLAVRVKAARFLFYVSGFTSPRDERWLGVVLAGIASGRCLVCIDAADVLSHLSRSKAHADRVLPALEAALSERERNTNAVRAWLDAILGAYRA